ncbi:MAG: DUF1540 domain-containing protein [Vallitalea sp.]|jgi:hypothetical protein|nr:DUF1540 domain-containing protein [Vallitalea sp.]
MELGNANTSIGCTVSDCKFHLDNNYCSLDRINVVTSSLSSTSHTKESTDCGSFQPKTTTTI